MVISYVSILRIPHIFNVYSTIVGSIDISSLLSEQVGGVESSFKFLSTFFPNFDDDGKIFRLHCFGHQQ